MECKQTTASQRNHPETQHITQPVPVKVVTTTTVKCNECDYKYTFNHTKRNKEIEIEIYTALNTIYQKERPPNRGSNHPCDKIGCKACQNLSKNRYITDYKGTKLSTIPFKCTLQNVVYCLTCNTCNQHYVGYTTRKLKDRMTIHRSSIAHQGRNAIAKHFNNNCTNKAPNKYAISILDSSMDTRNNPIKIKEATWIGRLNTITEGINERDEAVQLLNPHTLKIISHFNHSNTCWPYMTHVTNQITQDNMKRYQRVIINSDLRIRLPNHKQNRT
jgi:acetyltransferase-like isoleucine patch superfamily enzyme